MHPAVFASTRIMPASGTNEGGRSFLQVDRRQALEPVAGLDEPLTPDALRLTPTKRPAKGTMRAAHRLKKGLVLLSLPMVVLGPWPGYTLTPSPRGKIFVSTPWIN